MTQLTAMVSAQQHNDLLDYLTRSFAVDFTNWQNLSLNGRLLGSLNPRWQQQLQLDLPNLLQMTEQGFHLECRDWLHCADVLQNLGRDWYDLGLFEGWRNEAFDVVDGDEALFSLERSLFRPLGLLSKAVHINGFTERDGETLMWIGTRSPFKAVDPDKLDNLVGGGVGSGECLTEACLREGFEEAGLGSNIMQTLAAPKRILSQRLVERGLHREHLFCYDLDVPAHIQPENQDGEVAAFQLMGIDEVVQAILDQRFMHDAALITINGLLNKGLIDSKHPLSLWLYQQYC
ncbi:NUDIX hydrolase [Vitreoscilla stercoraria]|uniref:NUDIX domain-containing protein n=1 Tax=Vitreoscilla stercoraria TaxID=61 RepID=A0ABY4EGL9_VITST|nr:NUDIX domain-containing protein [Vitreoscilla stercoraria]UOO92547.1 NUDIX domain-containing protein [Vitreoscilla stercoraria]